MTPEPVSQEPGVQEPVSQETGAQETGAQETGAQETGAQETGAQETGAQETGAQETGAQDGPAGTPAARAGRPAGAISTAAILNALASAVLVIDRMDRIRYVNPAAEQLLGMGARLLLHRPLAGILTGDSPLFPLIGRVRAAGGPVSRFDLTLSGPRAGPQRLVADASPFPDLAGAVLLVLRGPGMAVAMERQRGREQAMRSVTAMSAILAHEIRNPLTGIRGAAQLLEEGAAPEDRHLARLVRDETDRIAALVDRMGVFEAAPARRYRPVNLHEVLHHVCRLAAAGAPDIRFTETCDPSLPAVHGDRDSLIQLFQNLVSNAVRAVPAAGGTVTLVTRYRHDHYPTRLPLTVTVQDNGPGIPADLRASLFSPFVTGRPGGTGLGLALVAKIVADHGGVIEWDSAPGHTCFQVALPHRPSHRPPRARATRQADPRPGHQPVSPPDSLSDSLPDSPLHSGAGAPENRP